MSSPNPPCHATAALLIAGVGLVAVACASPEDPVSLLENPDLQRVVELQTARDGGALADLLGDRSAAVRARAAFALASVQDQNASTALIEVLGDDDATVRANAAFALGQLPQMSGAVESALLEHLASDPDTLVRIRAAEALGKVGRPTASDALARVEPNGSVGAAAALALARMLARGTHSPAGLDALVARLVDARPEVRRDAAWGIGHSFQPGLWQDHRDRVFAALDAYDRADEAAGDLLRALGWIQDPTARARIVDWLQRSTEWKVRVAAAEALAGARAPAERAALARALDDEAVQVRIAAATSLSAATPTAAELDHLQGWIAAHSDEPHVAGPLLLPLAAAGRARPVLDWIASAPPGDAVRGRHAIAAAAALPGDEAIAALGAASRSEIAAISGAATQSLALRWVQGDRGSPAARTVFYQAFVDGLRRRDAMLAPLIAEVLTDSIFESMGSAAVRAELGPIAEPSVAPMTSPDWTLLEELGERPRLRLETELGAIVAELDAAEAPLSVQSLARLAREGRLDGVPFHRVVPAFMVQGGDYTRGDGSGDPGFRLPTEITTARYLRGTLGMARFDKDTESSQFFITQSMQPHLDGGYTAFGRVVEGMDVVDRILEGHRIVRARVEPGRPAGAQAGSRPVGSEAGRRAANGAISRRTASAGSGARITAPATAMPAARVRAISAARSGVMPPTATTGTGTERATSSRRASPITSPASALVVVP
jgi:peptidylprolyl isomerase